MGPSCGRSFRARASRLVFSALLFLTILGSRPADAEARCFHFCRGQIGWGVGFGGLWSGEGSSFLTNLHGDYYILDGLSFGMELRYLSDPGYLLPELSLRYTPFLQWNIVPFVSLKGGRTFTIAEDYPEQATAAVGLGVAYFITPFVALRVGASRRFFKGADASELEGGVAFFLD
jgi:hypothetical protein